eukprot:Hpha_TRINITY_DN15271_c4_g17::TRINITY_DN15271_c4_g17_i1::g.67413::m.67413
MENCFPTRKGDQRRRPGMRPARAAHRAISRATTDISIFISFARATAAAFPAFAFFAFLTAVEGRMFADTRGFSPAPAFSTAGMPSDGRGTQNARRPFGSNPAAESEGTMIWLDTHGGTMKNTLPRRLATEMAPSPLPMALITLGFSVQDQKRVKPFSAAVSACITFSTEKSPLPWCSGIMPRKVQHRWSDVSTPPRRRKVFSSSTKMRQWSRALGGRLLASIAATLRMKMHNPATFPSSSTAHMFQGSAWPIWTWNLAYARSSSPCKPMRLKMRPLDCRLRYMSVAASVSTSERGITHRPDFSCRVTLEARLNSPLPRLPSRPSEAQLTLDW